MKAKVRVNLTRDAVALSKDQERMRRRHGNAIKVNPVPSYDVAEHVEQEQHFSPPKLLPNGIYRSILSGVCLRTFQACSRFGRRASMSLFVFRLDSCGRIIQSCLRAAVLKFAQKPVVRKPMSRFA
jgi:hypothetical protein